MSSGTLQTCTVMSGSAEPLLPEMGNLKNSDTQAQQKGTGPSGDLGTASDDAVAVEPNPNLAHQNASQAADSQIQDETDRQLELAQSTAQDAMATATSALAQSHMAWARIQSHNPSEAGTTREAQIASVAATVAAAASVAKAAVEAAKAIAEISIDALMQAGAYGGTQLRLKNGQDLFQVAYITFELMLRMVLDVRYRKIKPLIGVVVRICIYNGRCLYGFG